MKAITDRTVLTNIMHWIDRISIPQKQLGGFAVCPFARAAKDGVKLFEVDTFSKIKFDHTNFEVAIIRFPDSITVMELINGCKLSNQQYPDLIFLPDPRDRKTDINGIPTNNGVYNLILCQPRNSLSHARRKLYKTAYYSFWDRDYLKEILGDDIVNLD